MAKDDKRTGDAAPHGERERLLTAALEVGAIGAWIWSLNDDRVTLVGAQERLLELEPGSFAGTFEALIACVHPQDRETVRAALGRCAEQRADYEEPIRIDCKQGHVRWLQTRARVVEADDGAYVVATSHDVTDYRRADEKLAQSARQIRLAMEAAQLGVWVADMQTQSLSHPQPGGFLVHLSPEQWPTDLDMFMHWVHPADRIHVGQAVERAAAGGKVYRADFRVVLPDGTVRWVHSRGDVLTDEAGQPDLLVGIDMDITSRKEAEARQRQLEARIEHAQRLESLGVLAGGIAHDFNNLLVGILGNADLALLDMPEGSPARGRIEEIQAAGVRASELTQQMLAYSGRGKFVTRPLDLNALITEMSQLLHVAIGKSCSLKFELHQDLPLVEADVAQLQQVVMNLITNASEAIGEGQGIIAVRTGVVPADTAGGQYVMMEVEDNGCGMDEATRTRIFEPFFTTKFTGRGLGLAGVLGIVQGHRGTLRVESEPGRGTTISVLFPAMDADRRAEAVSPAPPSRAWRGSGTVLVVDDEEATRSVVTNALTRLGFTVLAAANGREGVDIFKRRAGELVLVLLDMTMPELGGAGAFRAMQQHRAAVPVILMSGYSEQDAIQRFGGQGLAGFLQKPFKVSALLEQVQTAIAAPRF